MSPPVYGVYGPKVFGDTLANEHVGGSLSNQCSYRFRAEQSSNLDSVTVYVIANGNTGYSNGTGGTIRCRLYADDGTSSHLPTGSALATATSVSPGNPASDDFPTFSFGTPYSVTSGTLYHLQFDNTDASPSVNYCSLDGFADLSSVKSPQQPGYEDTDLAFLVKRGASAWEQRTFNLTPIMDIAYANGQHQGMGYTEVGIVSYTVSISGNTMVRETFTVSGGNRTVTGVGVSLSRYSGTGALSVRLETGAGTEIETVSIAAASIALSTDVAYPDFGTMTRVEVPFASSHTLTNGSSYNVRLSAPSGTTYRMHSMRRAGGSYGINSATHFNDGYGQKSTNGGSSWGAIRTSPDWATIEDILMYLRTVS